MVMNETIATRIALRVYAVTGDADYAMDRFRFYTNLLEKDK